MYFQCCSKREMPALRKALFSFYLHSVLAPGPGGAGGNMDDDDDGSGSGDSEPEK